MRRFYSPHEGFVTLARPAPTRADDRTALARVLHPLSVEGHSGIDRASVAALRRRHAASTGRSNANSAPRLHVAGVSRFFHAVVP